MDHESGRISTLIDEKVWQQEKRKTDVGRTTKRENEKI
jgi:hypothetical protein